MNWKILFPLGLTSVLLLSGCGAVRINQLVSDPMRYQNRNVRIEGQVTNSFGALVAGGYLVDDGSGKILVISNRPAVPLKGSRVRVGGHYQSGVSLMGRSYGNIIREGDVRVLR